MILLSAWLASAPGVGPVDVDLVPSATLAPAGCTIEVELVLTSSSLESISAVDAVLSWDPAKLELLQATPSGAGWFASGFFNDPDGINDDEFDGEAIWTALGNFGAPPTVPPDLVVAAFEFRVLADAQLELLPQLGAAATKVFGVVPGQELTGSLPAPLGITEQVVQATEVSRLGTPPNPNALLPGVTQAPVIGTTWDPRIDHATFLPTAVVDVLFVAVLPDELALGPPYGTLLCDIFLVPPLLFGAGAGAPFTLPIPLNCNLVGKSFCAQGLSLDGVTAELTNALDVTVGTF